MKTTFVAACLLAAKTAAFAGDVAVSVTVGQPGFYGRIDVGNAPPPVLVYSRPVVIAPAPVAVVQQPVYLRVPPGHAKKWAKHCAQYNACGQPVYFVQDNWYRNVYVPSYEQRRSHGQDNNGHDQGDHNGGGKHKDKQKHKD